MPKILLTGENKIEVSNETAQRVKEQLEAGEKRIEINNRYIKSSRIVDIDFGSAQKKTYNLNNPEDKRIIKEFEQELLDAKKWELDRELECYGEPIKTIKAVGKLPEKELPDGFVKNPVLGLCHWSKVQYCLKNCIISRKEGKWFVADANNYTDWLEKNNALHELKLRREFAESKNKEETDEFLKSLESTKVAKPMEEEIEIPDDNPLKWM